MIIPKQESAYDTLLIDGNHFLWRAIWAATRADQIKSACPAGLIFIKMLAAETLSSGAGTVIVCWESGSNWKQGIQGYKIKDHTNRPPELFAYHAMMKQFLPTIGIHQSWAIDHEADAVIAAHSHYCSRENKRVLIVSRDHDFQQLTALSGVHVKAHKEKGKAEILTQEKVMTMYEGLHPSLLPTVWCLSGDSADKLKGVPGIGLKTAVQIVQTLGELTTWIDYSDRFIDKVSPLLARKLIDHRDHIKQTYELINLLDHKTLPTTLEGLVVVDGTPPTDWVDIFETRADHFYYEFLRGLTPQ